MTTLAPGHTYFSGTYSVAAVKKSTHRHLVVVWVAAIAVVAAGLVTLSGALETPTVRYVCPPDCGRPPIGDPVTVNPRFAAADGSFSVSYPAAASAYAIATDAEGVTADLRAGDGGTMRLFGQPAAGRSAEQIATELIAKTFPNAKMAYDVPNAMVGYHPGYGVVADWWPQGAAASYSRMRVMVLVGIKDGLALIAGAVGPYHPFGPEFGSGKPSAASLQLALDMGKYVNSFAWRGDPPR